MFTYGETVTLRTRSASSKDALGNDVMTETTQTVTNVPVWPTGANEVLNAQDLGTDSLTMVLPVGYQANLIDAVTVFGESYEVDGQPGRYTNPFTGFVPGEVVRLRRAVG
jgi:hypothetical protein